jgi:hypothetical protein
MSAKRTIVTFTISIDVDGNVTNDVQPFDSTFAEVYKAFHCIKAEVQRQIAERRNCPFNPLHGTAPVIFEDAE